MDLEQIKRIIAINRNKQFVKRIIRRDNYQPLDLGVDANGKHWTATHKMSWGDDGRGNYFVYPTVAEGPDGRLMEFGGTEAWGRAKATGDFIHFDNAGDADAFSQQYKKYWEPEPAKKRGGK